MSGGGETRNDDIEALRAVAVLMVLYEHFGTLHYSETLRGLRMLVSGWTGVDLFFCISGFVIYRSLSATLAYGDTAAAATRQIVAFWIRRFWRLAPAAWLWLLLALPAGYPAEAVSPASYYQHIAAEVASLLNLENVHRYVCESGGLRCSGVVGHYWSLSLEVQFYAVLPVAMLALPRRWLAGAMAGLIVVQFAWVRPAFDGSLGWYLRTDALAWGVLLAIATQGRLGPLLRPAFLASAPARAAFTLGLIGLLATAKLFDAEGIFSGIAGVLSALLVWAAAYNAGFVWRPVVLAVVLRWVGLRSYSLYLSHLIVFRYVRLALHGLGDTLPLLTAQAVLAYALTFAAAALTYHVVERPLRRRGRAAATRYLAATALAA